MAWNHVAGASRPRKINFMGVAEPYGQLLELGPCALAGESPLPQWVCLVLPRRRAHFFPVERNGVADFRLGDGRRKLVFVLHDFAELHWHVGVGSFGFCLGRKKAFLKIGVPLLSDFGGIFHHKVIDLHLVAVCRPLWGGILDDQSYLPASSTVRFLDGRLYSLRALASNHFPDSRLPVWDDGVHSFGPVDLLF